MNHENLNSVVRVSIGMVLGAVLAMVLTLASAVA